MSYYDTPIFKVSAVQYDPNRTIVIQEVVLETVNQYVYLGQLTQAFTCTGNKKATGLDYLRKTRWHIERLSTVMLKANGL